MITQELCPGIVSATVEDSEFAVIRDSVHDLSGMLQRLAEAELLDELDRRAIQVCERLPAIRELTTSVASRRGPKVAVLRLPESSTEEAGPTPTEHILPGQPNLFPPDLYRGLLVGLAGWYGYGFTTQQQGLIHNNVIATKRFAYTPSHSASAHYELGLHTEEASYALTQGLDISPDFFSLHFLRNPSNVPTVVSIPDWGRLSAETLGVLRQPWFVNRTNPAQGGERNDLGVPVPIVYGPDGQHWIRLNTARLDADAYGDRHKGALADLISHLVRRRVNLALSPGSIAIIDNRRVVHGRPAYQGGQSPRYDGTDRWTRRLAASTDRNRIREFEAAPRVVDPNRFLVAARQHFRHVAPQSSGIDNWAEEAKTHGGARLAGADT